MNDTGRAMGSVTKVPPRTARSSTRSARVPLSVAVLVLAAITPGFSTIAPAWAASRPTTTSSPRGTTSISKPVKTATPTTSAARDLKSELEATLVRAQQSAAPGMRVGKAQCPAVLAVPKSQLPEGTFQCTVDVEGVRAPYKVVLTKGGGFRKGGTYKISPVNAIIDTEKVVAFVRAQIDAADQAAAQITCAPSRVLVIAVGKTFTCTVANVPSVTQVTLVVKDNAGTIAIKT